MNFFIDKNICLRYDLRKEVIQVTENERLKQLRKDYLHLTLDDFGARLGLGKSAISGIETGYRNLTQQTRMSICREFNVREEWLRDGEGEPFQNPGSREEEISEFIGKTLQTEKDDFKIQLLHVLSRLTDEQWGKLADVAEMLRSVSEADPPEK